MSSCNGKVKKVVRNFKTFNIFAIHFSYARVVKW